MQTSENLLMQESHFAFGENWASYSKLVRDAQIESAVTNLRRLLGNALEGKRFLDIGCGSGLHALAALRLGASEVVAVDIDQSSIDTTRDVLTRFAAGERWRALRTTVFDLDPEVLGQFDVVYSWGVLHHTGDMHRALLRSIAMLRPRGEFVFALYRKTRLCWLWKIEKRWYAQAGKRAQGAMRTAYLILKAAGCWLTGRSYKAYEREYISNRGMDFRHDMHDWLGGWPYESISPAEVDVVMRGAEMQFVRSFVAPKVWWGFLGSGCDEYVYARSRGAERACASARAGG